MAEVIFLVIVAICIIALFAIEGNRAKQLEKLGYKIAVFPGGAVTSKGWALIL